MFLLRKGINLYFLKIYYFLLYYIRSFGNVEMSNSIKDYKSFYASDIMISGPYSTVSFNPDFASNVINVDNNDDNIPKTFTKYDIANVFNKDGMFFFGFMDSLKFRVNDNREVSSTRIVHEKSIAIENASLKTSQEFAKEKYYKPKIHMGLREKKRELAFKNCNDTLLESSLDKIKSLNLESPDLIKNAEKNTINEFKAWKMDMKYNNIHNINDDNKNVESFRDLENTIIPGDPRDRIKTILELEVSRKNVPVEYKKEYISEYDNNYNRDSFSYSQLKNVDAGFDSMCFLSNSRKVSSSHHHNLNSNKTSRFSTFFASDSINLMNDVEKNNLNLLSNNEALSTEYFDTGLIHKSDYNDEFSEISIATSKTSDEVGFQRIMDMLRKSNQSISTNRLVSHNSEIISNKVDCNMSNEYSMQNSDDLLKYQSIMHKNISDSNFFLSLLNQSSRLSLHVDSLNNDNINVSRD
ncbi:hypothetical protein T552_04125 [Pneumocystis carinii B80]|uniref:Uncharacterized protein n=1 Tax=Pneumocystis carinii (strain B80) TaxID=1408658 RepID=A0A0W4ZJ98_PNEC8|nr:hypothetical protein T552_04125 [Pneumocystis carinii B80]KTW28439.1 hypothetical protein T552_04125 [Pneumocystis carinii B80]